MQTYINKTIEKNPEKILQIFPGIILLKKIQQELQIHVHLQILHCRIFLHMRYFKINFDYVNLHVQLQK